MKIDLSGIIKNEGGKINFEGFLNPEEIRLLPDEIALIKPVRAAGSVTNEGEVLTLRVNIEGAFSCRCGRCAKSISREFLYSVAETLMQGDCRAEETSGEDVVVFFGMELEICDIVANGIIINLPIRQLCCENCRGLCQKCGKDLNEGDCGCNHDEIDPRLAKLLEI